MACIHFALCCVVLLCVKSLSMHMLSVFRDYKWDLKQRFRHRVVDELQSFNAKKELPANLNESSIFVHQWAAVTLPHH